MTSPNSSQPAVRAELLRIAHGVADLDWDVSGDATRFDDIGAESIDLLNIAMEIERHFGISLAGISPYDLSTTGDLLRVVLEALRTRGA